VAGDRRSATVCGLALVALGCGGIAPHESSGVEASDGDDVTSVTITATLDSARFVVREHMLAAGEMQISGEPLAEAMGRDLSGYSRDLIPTDVYQDPATTFSWIDLPGFSTGVESYEYSKQPMNELAFESGAGTALSPLVGGDAMLAVDIEHYATSSNAIGKWVFPAGTFPTNNGFGDDNPDGAGSAAANPLGWPGIWPTAHVFASFDPTLAPTSDTALHCSIATDDNPNEAGLAVVCSDFECDATTLHLPDRATQIDATVTPGADGFATWKFGLWSLNYLQIMHDGAENPVTSVPPDELAAVGQPGGSVFLGSSDIEGFQAAMFLAIADARAADWLTSLTTSDGVALSGFASIEAALAYDYAAPLRWFPSAIGVTEAAGSGLFPQPSYSLASADSDLLDQLGLAMGYAEMYALTDQRNADVGGSQPALAYFDGDPFPADDQLADGEATLHDRALAMMRVALVDADRIHTDPASGLLVDDVVMDDATPVRGTTLATTTVAYVLVGLRTVRRALSSQLELYSNNVPDTAGISTPLDALPIAYPGDSTLTFAGRIDQMLRAHAELLYDHLTDASGRAWPGWDVAAGAPTSDDDTLDAHTAAIRGLFAAYLATGDTRFRERAIAVYERLDAVFYDATARIYGATPAPVATVQYTPLRFALLQSALRDVYELYASRPGQEALEPVVEERLARLNKLVLNGWDDRNLNRVVDWPDECVRVEDGLPRGGLQMAERSLTGEIGRLNDEGGGSGPPTTDREHDCVPAIDAAHTSASLADSITLTVTRQ
jgi:hypothetical protein